jgi:ABC-2 type transport system permease protein
MQPPQPLSTLVKGLDSEVDRAISVRQQIAFGSRQEGIESSGPSGTPDTFFMVKLLVSLFALIISLGTITREREAGTLRMMLVQPVRRRTIILGKALGATACLLICLAVAFLGQFLYLKIGQNLIQDRQEVLRVLLLFAVAALYGIVFVLLGLFISTIAVRTRAAIVMALLGWVTIVLVLPNTAVLLANLLSPAPSYNQLNARLHEARQQVINQTLREHPGVTSVLDLPNAREVIFKAFETDRRITDEYLDSKLQQVKLAHLLSALSPAGALSSGQSSLAGTGVSAYSSYLQFLRSQRDMIVDALQRQWDMPAPEGARLVQRTMQEINQQQRPAEGFEASLSSSVLPSLSLIFWGAAFGLGAWWRFEKYDVR